MFIFYSFLLVALMCVSLRKKKKHHDIMISFSCFLSIYIPNICMYAANGYSLCCHLRIFRHLEPTQFYLFIYFVNECVCLFEIKILINLVVHDKF